MAQVTYKGPTRRGDGSTRFRIDGVLLTRDEPVEVNDDALLKELREGSDRTTGHKFEVEASKAADRKPSTQPQG